MGKTVNWTDGLSIGLYALGLFGIALYHSRKLKSQDDILRRIEEAGKYCSVDQLGISPQCGFYHGADVIVMSEAEQWKKLELVVKVAQKVWG